jgi:putative flippase GtrA
MILDARFLRYVLVGTLAFVVDLSVTLALVVLVPHYLVANTLGFMTANGLQFFIAHHWVFEGAAETTPWKAYCATLGISVAGLALSNLLVYAGVDGLGLPLAVAKAVTAVLVLGFNYLLRVALVYRRP